MLVQKYDEEAMQMISSQKRLAEKASTNLESHHPLHINRLNCLEVHLQGKLCLCVNCTVVYRNRKIVTKIIHTTQFPRNR